jgi:hypothetical protein
VVDRTSTGILNPGRNRGLEVSIYPIPVIDHLNIEFNREPTEDLEIRILEITGKTIKSFTHRGKSLLLDLENLQAGYYIVTISGECIHEVMSIVKQKQ